MNAFLGILGYWRAIPGSKLSFASLGLGSLAALQLQYAVAADLTVEAAIAKVTAYQRGATVTRSATVAIPAGSHRLIFKDLPANIDASLIRVIVNSKSVKLGSVDIESFTQADYVAAQERQLRREIEKLQDEKTAIEDDIQTAEAQLRVLNTVAFGHSPEDAKSSVDIQSLQGVIGTIASSGASARTRIREANLRKRDIDRAIAKFNEDLKKVATARKESLVVRATLDASVAVNTPVSVLYNVNDAQWQWIYEAHLDSAAKQVSLRKLAQVRQGSGEDWGGVELTLTTSLPSRNNALAPLSSLLVRSENPETAHRTQGVPLHLEEIVVTAQMRGKSRNNTRPQEEADEDEDLGSYVAMDTSSTEFLTEYLVPGRVTLAANREPRMFPVNDDKFAVDLVARTVPKRERQAYLEATFKYERDVPLQSGELQLFRDDAFIGKAFTDAFMPGTEVRLPFGVDERIRVAVRQEPEQSGKRGVFGRQKLKDERLRFEVSNYHSYPIRVEVLDRIPIPKSGDVHVDIPAGGTAPTQRDYQNKPGVMLWALNVEPRQTANIKHYVEIRYPADKRLAGYEPTE